MKDGPVKSQKHKTVGTIYCVFQIGYPLYVVVIKPPMLFIFRFIMKEKSLLGKYRTLREQLRLVNTEIPGLSPFFHGLKEKRNCWGLWGVRVGRESRGFLEHQASKVAIPSARA